MGNDIVKMVIHPEATAAVKEYFKDWKFGGDDDGTEFREGLAAVITRHYEGSMRSRIHEAIEEAGSSPEPLLSPINGEDLYMLMLATTEMKGFDGMEDKQVMALFEGWTQEQRDEAEKYFAGVSNSAMAGEYQDDYPAVICPAHLKEYGGRDLAAVESEKE